LARTIDNFLSDEECNEIIKSCQGKFHNLDRYDKDYRDGQRLIAFDKNNILVNTIQDRLHNDSFIDRLNNRYWKKPYGFVSNYNWFKNNGTINKCIRINRYNNSKGFDWHRDGQYTSDSNIRSNYTLLIYLNDSEGTLSFKHPYREIIGNGYTIDEEMDILNNREHETYTMKCKKGMAVIFDQRIIHKASKVTDTKYVLRTDLLCKGIYNHDKESKLEKQLNKLTRRLFRQAQYYELAIIDKSNYNHINKWKTKSKKLYEICISLRQNPDKITEYPKHLEKLLEPININRHIMRSYNGSCELILISRSGFNYTYQYSNVNNKNSLINILKVASSYTFATWISYIQCGVKVPSNPKYKYDYIKKKKTIHDFKKYQKPDNSWRFRNYKINMINNKDEFLLIKHNVMNQLVNNIQANFTYEDSYNNIKKIYDINNILNKPYYDNCKPFHCYSEYPNYGISSNEYIASLLKLPATKDYENNQGLTIDVINAVRIPCCCSLSTDTDDPYYYENDMIKINDTKIKLQLNQFEYHIKYNDDNTNKKDNKLDESLNEYAFNDRDNCDMLDDCEDWHSCEVFDNTNTKDNKLDESLNDYNCDDSDNTNDRDDCDIDYDNFIDNIKVKESYQKDDKSMIIKGTITIKTPTNQFNHASCQCETTFIDFQEIDTVIISIEANFTINKQKRLITIEFDPKVIL
jgi:hypothetical protein